MKNVALIWEVTAYLLKNHFAQIAGYVMLFLAIAFVFSIVYSIVLYRYKLLKRKNKYYNWLVKLHIPIMFIINMYFGLQMGTLYGGYKTIQKEIPGLSKEMVARATQWAFNSEEHKQTSLRKLQMAAKSLQNENKSLQVNLLDIVKAYNTDLQVVDNSKNKLAERMLRKYGDKLQSYILYGLLSKVPKIEISEQMSFEEFDAGVQYLLDVDHTELESSIATKLSEGTNYLLKSQFTSLMRPLIIIWLLLMAIPLIEYGIYRYTSKSPAQPSQKEPLP